MEAAEVISKWTNWMQGVGDALADVGSPFGPGTSLVDDGTTGTALSLTGYSIVTANDLDEARRLADGHPYLSEGSGNFAIDIYELMPAPFDQ
jgi:hypothetical protein